MFTGIIETTGTIQSIVKKGTNIDFWIQSSITSSLKVDQSVSHNGVCLTVIDIQGTSYKVTAVDETLAKTDLGSWKEGDAVNLERAMKNGDRLDGHFVQGHVDATITCIKREELDGSWLFRFRYPTEFAHLLIEKGSACLNGVSLTVFNITADTFTVTIIPYTYEHTGFKSISEGCILNIEFDVLGKYIARHLSLYQAHDKNK